MACIHENNIVCSKRVCGRCGWNPREASWRKAAIRAAYKTGTLSKNIFGLKYYRVPRTEEKGDSKNAD